MKKLFVSLSLSLSLIFSSCDVLQQVMSNPSQLEMILGLKDALTQGMNRGLGAFNNPDANPIVRFVFPGEAAKIEKTLNDLGLNSLVKQVTNKFTNATVKAVNTAKPMFINSIKQMSFTDVLGILVTENQRAATDYFKSSMYNGLMSEFRPIVDSTINLEGANKDWASIVKVYNAIPFTNQKLENSLTDFLSARAIDAIFNIVADEEKQIRTNLNFRTTDTMKKVFNYADQELAKRKQTNS